MQAYDSIMCGYFCIGFNEFMLKGKSFLDYTNLFSPDDYKKDEKNEKKMKKDEKMKKYIELFVVSIENLKNLKNIPLIEKTLVLSIICSKCKNEDEKLFKEE